MKKIIAFLTSLLVLLFFASCEKAIPNPEQSATLVSTEDSNITAIESEDDKLHELAEFSPAFDSFRDYENFKTALNSTDAEAVDFLKYNGYMSSYYDAGIQSKKDMQALIKLIDNLQILYFAPNSGFNLGFFEVCKDGYLHMTFGNGAQSIYVITYFDKTHTKDIQDSDTVFSTAMVSNANSDLYLIANATGAIKAKSYLSTENSAVKVMFGAESASIATEVFAELMNEYAVITTLNELLGE